jgi:hypothetical protein
LDRRLFDSNPAVADLRPAGLLSGIAALTPTSGGDKDSAMKDDLQKLIGSVAVVAGNSPIVLVASPAQAVAINLRTLGGSFAYGVLPSSQLAAGTVIAVATAALVTAANGAPKIDATKTASLTMDDAPGAILTGGQHVVATFQNDTVGLRMRLPISWALRDPRGVAFMNSVTW